MTVTRIKRLTNPAKRRNASARRKMSPKQIKFFGSARQRAALKAARTRKRAATHRAAPRRRTANPGPATLLILGNPTKRKAATKKRRKNPMAKATRKQLAALRKARAARRRMSANPRRRTRRSNPHRVHARARRRSSSVRRRNSTKVYVIQRNRRGVARRNPEMFGMSGSTAGKAILAGLVGVYATKTVTPMVANIVPQVGSSNIMAALISGIVAWGGGYLVGKWDKTADAGFMFGGLMQAGSQLLNSIVPANPLSLSGLGDFYNVSGANVGVFPVNNAIRTAAMMRAAGALAPPAASNLNGMGAAAAFH